MKKLFASAAMTLALSGIAGAATAAECGDVTIANMNWQSAEVLASIDKIILNDGYGCNAELVVGDTVPTITSMIEKGQPDIAPEGWVDLLPDVVSRGIAEGKLVIDGRQRFPMAPCRAGGSRNISPTPIPTSRPSRMR